MLEKLQKLITKHASENTIKVNPNNKAITVTIGDKTKLSIHPESDKNPNFRILLDKSTMPVEAPIAKKVYYFAKEVAKQFAQASAALRAEARREAAEARFTLLLDEVDG